ACRARSALAVVAHRPVPCGHCALAQSQAGRAAEGHGDRRARRSRPRSLGDGADGHGPRGSRRSTVSRVPSALVSENEVEARSFEIGAHQLDVDAVTKTEALVRSVADHLMARRVVLEVIVAELRHVHHPLDIDMIKGDEDPERGNAADGSGKTFADAIP